MVTMATTNVHLSGGSGKRIDFHLASLFYQKTIFLEKTAYLILYQMEGPGRGPCTKHEMVNIIPASHLSVIVWDLLTLGLIDIF